MHWECSGMGVGVLLEVPPIPMAGPARPLRCAMGCCWVGPVPEERGEQCQPAEILLVLHAG